MAAALFFLLFSVGMIKARTRRQVLAVALAGGIAVVLVAPRPVEAQGTLVGAIQTVTKVINGIIHTSLGSIQEVRSTMNGFYQRMIWPETEINQARGLATQMIAQYRNPMSNIFHTNLASATLPGAQGLEQIARNQQTGDFSALTSDYADVYGPVPAPSTASPENRDMTDMDDALAEDTLKTVKESDEADNMTLGAADRIENAATQAAPGSAPFLTATAVVGAIESQAAMQKMIAAELRQEAAYLAHRNALRKQGALSASRLANALLNVLH